MITINQINGRTAQNATIQLYLNTDRDNWRARSFDFKFEFKGTFWAISNKDIQQNSHSFAEISTFLQNNH